MKKEIILILDNIRSAQNVGSIFRTAEAAGVSKIYLMGYTPAPLDRFDRKRMDVAKASLGAEDIIPWEIKKNLPSLIVKLKKDNFLIVALEQSKSSVDYKKIKIKNKMVLIVGNEVLGLSKGTLDKVDKIAEIKMLGKKESLNVSVALGVALYRICDL